MERGLLSGDFSKPPHGLQWRELYTSFSVCRCDKQSYNPQADICIHLGSPAFFECADVGMGIPLYHPALCLRAVSYAYQGFYIASLTR